MTSGDQLFSPVQSSGCPVTGLPITTRPEWTEIQLKPDYSVTFSIIGKAILLITPKGYPSEEGAKALLEKRVEFIREAGLSDRNYVELRDYRMLSGSPPKGGRMVLTNFLLKEGAEGHLKGFWVFGAPLLIRLIFKTGLKLLKSPIPVGIAKDYEEAIRGALKVLRQSGVDVGSKLYPRIKKEGWALEIEEYGISFELIGDDIIYTIARGRQKEPHVEKFFELHEKVLQEAGLTQKGYYYRIINWEGFVSITWKARLMYLAGLKELNRKTPCRLSVIFGLNKFMKALVAINRPFVSIPVMVAKDLQDALEIIERQREQETGPGPVGKTQKPEAKTYTEEQLKGFANEMLQIIGGINWDQAGISTDGMSEEHPLKPVLDALAIVKLDLDNLIQEKESSRISLQESEGKYRNILENMNDSYFEVDLQGNLTFCNPILPKLLGYTQKEISGMNYQSYMDSENAEIVTKNFRKVYQDGASAKVISYEVTSRDGLKIPAEASFSLMKNGEGKPIGFRGIVRDSTDRKKAEQENAILAEIGLLIGSTLDIDEVYERFVNEVRKLIAFDRLVVNLNKPQEGILSCVYVYGRDIPGRKLRETFPLAGTVNEVLIRTRKGLIIQPTSLEEIADQYSSLVSTFQAGMRSMMSVPLIARDEVIGGLHFRAMKPNSYTAETLRLAEGIGMQIAGAMANAQLFNDLSKTEKSLRESEKQFRRLADNMQDLVMEVDTMGIIQYISPSSRYLGYEPDEMIGQLCFNLLHPEDKDRMVGAFAEALADPIHTLYLPPYRVITKNGELFWIEGYGTSLFDEDQRLIGGLIVGRNITVRKQAEEKLLESEEKYRNILESIEDGYFEVDLTGNITFFNPSLCGILGYPREEMMGLNNRAYMDPENAKKVFQTFNEISVTGIPSKGFEWEIIQKDGARKHLEVSVSLIASPGEKPTGFRGVARDVTERRQEEEEEKRSLEERLNRAEKMEAIGTLAGGVAHDLNNVLGVLSGYSELLLLEIPEGSRSRGHVEKILQSTEKGAAIIQDLLTLARRGVTASDVINLSSVVSDFLKTPVFEKMKDYHPHVTFRTEYDQNLLNIKGSLVHLGKTVMNLVSNAAEAISGKGEVTIRTESRYLDKAISGYDKVKEGDYAVLTVSDTGMGIPAKNREKIFEPFYTKKTMGRSGTGLGLAIVWGTVKDHNGYIDLQTEVGQGTSFTLYFPVTQEELVAPQQKVPIESYMGKGESVLVVDDVPEQRDIASRLLTRLGYEVHVVSSGEEAIEYLKGNKADILVLDMIMEPGIDGLETYKRVLKVNPKQKAILVSGFSETDRVKKAQKLGAGAYVKKPYVMEKIGVAIRDELQKVT